MSTRYFCGLSTLRLQATKPAEAWAGNSPVWNIRTARPVLNDHNDFDNPLLLELMRQLYIEAEDKRLVQLRNAR